MIKINECHPSMGVFMLNFNHKQLLLLLKVTVLCLSLSVVSSNKGWAQVSTNAEIRALTAKLESNNSNRQEAVKALERMGPPALPALTRALQDKATEVRSTTVSALGSIHAPAKEVVPLLVKTLQDKNAVVREHAASALGKIGSEDAAAVPALMTSLQDGDEQVRSSDIYALERIFTVFQARAKTLSDSELDRHIADLRKTLFFLENSTARFKPEDITLIRSTLNSLNAEQKSRLFHKPLQFTIQHPWVFGVAGYFLFLPSLWLLILWFRPLWVLRLNRLLKRHIDFVIPTELGDINVSVRFLIFIGFLHYHPRVLHAWAIAQTKSVQKNFH